MLEVDESRLPFEFQLIKDDLEFYEREDTDEYDALVDLDVFRDGTIRGLRMLYVYIIADDHLIENCTNVKQLILNSLADRLKDEYLVKWQVATGQIQ